MLHGDGNCRFSLPSFLGGAKELKSAFDWLCFYTGNLYAGAGLTIQMMLMCISLGLFVFIFLCATCVVIRQPEHTYVE